MKQEFEILYSKELIDFLKFLNKDKVKLIWWKIHSDEHPTGMPHVGVRMEE